MEFCEKCGAEVPADAKFCPKCGRSLDQAYCESGSCDRGYGYGRGWDWDRGWSRGEWSPESATQWKKRWSWMWSAEWIMINLVFLGLFVIFVGLVLFLAAAGVTSYLDWSNFWAYLLIGTGTLMLLRDVARYFVAKRMLWPGGLTGGIILITLGMAGLVARSTGWGDHPWSFVIVAGGLAIIAAGIVNYLWTKARKNP